MNQLLHSLLIGFALICLGSPANVLAANTESAPRPNFLILMADDQYRPTLGCYGANPSHTPNIDQLAREGLRFTQCFTQSSICTANRAVFLSGMLPLKNGAHANHSGFDDGVKSLPNYMKALGYRAAIFNKDGKKQLSSKVDDWMRKTNDQGIESELESLRKHPPVVKHKP